MSRRKKDYSKIDKQIKTRKRKKILNIIIVLIPVLFVFFYIIRWPIYNSLLDKYGVKTKARIIDEKNIMGKGIITQKFTYSYEFHAHKKYYKGDSKNSIYKIGNKLEIEYLKAFPQINRVCKSEN